METGIHSFVLASPAVDGSCVLCCWQEVACSSKLIPPHEAHRADSVLNGLCTTLPSLWFGCDPLSISRASAARHRCVTLMALRSVSGAELNEGSGLRRVRCFWFCLFMS